MVQQPLRQVYQGSTFVGGSLPRQTWHCEGPRAWSSLLTQCCTSSQEVVLVCFSEWCNCCNTTMYLCICMHLCLSMVVTRVRMQYWSMKYVNVYHRRKVYITSLSCSWKLATRELCIRSIFLCGFLIHGHTFDRKTSIKHSTNYLPKNQHRIKLITSCYLYASILYKYI